MSSEIVVGTFFYSIFPRKMIATVFINIVLVMCGGEIASDFDGQTKLSFRIIRFQLACM